MFCCKSNVCLCYEKIKHLQFISRFSVFTCSSYVANVWNTGRIERKCEHHVTPILVSTVDQQHQPTWRLNKSVTSKYYKQHKTQTPNIYSTISLYLKKKPIMYFYGELETYSSAFRKPTIRAKLIIRHVLFSVALRPNAGHGLLIFEVSWSHTTTHHSR